MVGFLLLLTASFAVPVALFTISDSALLAFGALLVAAPLVTLTARAGVERARARRDGS